MLSAALLIARLVVGLSISAHGAQKLFGWFGGYGLAGTGGFFEQLGFRPGRLFAAGTLSWARALGEFGPILIFAGATRFRTEVLSTTVWLEFSIGNLEAGIAVSLLMIVAAVTVHWGKGFFATSNGIEMTVLYATVAILLALAGPGLYSLDALLGLETLWSPALTGVALVIGVIGAIANLAVRRRAPTPDSAPVGTT